MTHRNPANRMVDAAKAWLDSLDNRQQTAAAVPWPSDEERHRWYYTPTDHGGLPLQQMRPAQVSLEEVPEPDPALGSLLVETLAVGVCGTDTEIANGAYGWAPPGRDRLILGHESPGRVIDPGPSGFDVLGSATRRPPPARTAAPRPKGRSRRQKIRMSAGQFG